MEQLQAFWDVFLQVLRFPFIKLGNAQINLMFLLELILLFTVVLVVSRMLEAAVRRVAAMRSNMSDENPQMYSLGRLVRYAAMVLGFFVALNILGMDLTNFALIGGAIGVGIGFGLQNVVANFVSGIILLLDRSLKVGDFVDLESGVKGRVVEIDIRFTRITTNDLVDVLVPNSEFVNGRVVNWTYSESVLRIHVPFGVAYGSDKLLVREAAVAAARSVAGTIDVDKRRPDAWLVGFGDSALNFELVVWVESHLARAPGATQAKLMWAIDDELRLRNIEIPFPQRDLHVRSGVLQIKAAESAADGD